MEGSAFKRAARLHPYSVGSQVTGGLDMRQPEGHPRESAGWLREAPSTPHFGGLPAQGCPCSTAPGRGGGEGNWGRIILLVSVPCPQAGSPD